MQIYVFEITEREFQKEFYVISDIRISHKIFKIFINRDICILDGDIGIVKKSKDCDINVHNLRQKCQV